MAFYGPSAGRNSGSANINTAQRFTHRRKTIASFGAYDQTDVICYFSRWWWGEGTMLIRLYRYYYGPNSDHALFTVDGHTRSGNPSIGTIYNRGCDTPFCVASEYDQNRERATIKLTAGHYFRYMVELECYSMTHVSSQSAVGPNHGTTNAFHMPSSAEIYK